MRKAALIAVVAAALGFVIGRYTLAGKIAALETRAQFTDRDREAEASVATTLSRAVTAARTDGVAQPTPSAAPMACPPCQGTPDEIGALMGRISELTDKLDLGGVEETDMDAFHAEGARKVREDFFSKANLDEQQRAAIDPIVAQLDQSLKGPLERLEALESADHYAVSDWAQARVEVYQAMASAEGSLRALLSPQQRDALDKTEFSLVSQLGVERYSDIVGRGLFTDTSTEIDEPPPK